MLRNIFIRRSRQHLEDDQPGLPDEQALGMTYDQIDDYLEGKKIDTQTAAALEERYKKTEHKRQLPATIYDTWWKK